MIGASAATCDGLGLIVPGSPESSFFFQKLSEETPACGERMPNGDRLPDEQLQCVADWIYLMQKLLGVELCSGSQMPKAGQGLPGAQLEVVSTWICQGAQRN